MASWIWGASPFYEAVEKATSELLPAGSEDIALNLEICDQIRSKGVAPKEAMRALKSRLNHTNPNVQLLALNLTDICVKNGGQHFLAEIASRDFLDNLCSILRATHSLEVRNRILRYIQNWAHAFEGKATLGYANEVYKMLKSEGMVFPPLDTTVGSAAMVDSRTAPEWIDSDVCLRCRTAFTFTNRKHHCRNCGQVFCQACSSKNMPLPHFGITQEVRVCDTCATKLVKAKPERPPAPQIPPPHSRRHRPGRSHAEAEEDAELQRAIQLSIAEANAGKSGGYTPSGSKWSAPSSWGMSEPPLVDKSTRPGAEDDDDEELKAAIQASLELANAPRPSAPAAVEGDYVPSGYKPLPNYDLHPTESDAILTFNQTIQQAGQHGGASGLRYPVVGAMYNQAAAVQPKLARSLDDTGRKAEMLSEMHDKLSQAVKLYDHLQVSQTYGQAPYGQPQQYGHPQAAYGSPQYGQQYAQYDQPQQYGQPAQVQQFGYSQQYGQPSQPQQYAPAPQQPQHGGPAPGQPYGQYEQPQGQQYAPPLQQYGQQQPTQPYGQQQGYAPVSAPGQDQQPGPQYVPGPYSAPPEKMPQQQPYPPEKQQHYPPEKQQYISPPPQEVEQAMAPSPASLQRAGSLVRSNSIMHGAQPQAQGQGQYAPQPHGQGHYAPQSNAPYAPQPEAQYAQQPTGSYAPPPPPQQQLPQQPQTAASIPLPQSPPPQANYHQAFGAAIPPTTPGYQPTSATPAPPPAPQPQYQPATTPTPAPAPVQSQFQPGHHPGAQSMSVAPSQPLSFHPGHHAGSQSMSVAPTFQQPLSPGQQPPSQQQQSQFVSPQPPAPLQLQPQPPSVTTPAPQSPAGYMSPPPQQQQQPSWAPPSSTGMPNIASATPSVQQNTLGPSQPSQLPQPYSNVPHMYSAPQPQPTYTSGPLPAFPTAPTTMPQYHGGVEKNEQKEAMLISFD